VKTWFWLLVGAVLLAAYAWGDVYLLTVRRGDVQSNLEASYVWATPAFAILLWRFEVWRGKRERAEQARHEERLALQQAHHEERLAYLDAIDAKVDQLHQHLGVEPPAAD
jgi:type VI protein secretion system component VasK